MGSQKNKKRKARKRKVFKEANQEPRVTPKLSSPKTKVLTFDHSGATIRVEYKVNYARRHAQDVIAIRSKYGYRLNSEVVDLTPNFLTGALVSWNLTDGGNPIPITYEAMQHMPIYLLNTILNEIADDI